MNLSIVIPTIARREALLERTLESYKRTVPDAEIVVVSNHLTIGEAWNAGVEQSSGGFVQLSADDVQMHDGWLDPALEAVARSGWPSPRIIRPQGGVEACGTLGAGMLLPECADWTPCYSSPFPFFERTAWDFIGPCLPIHYYADDWLAWRARAAGLKCAVRRSYCLTHLEGLIGRRRVVERAQEDRATMLREVGRAAAIR